MTMPDPTLTDYATDTDAEQDLFGNPGNQMGDDDPPADDPPGQAPAAPPRVRRAPGPPPNPNSKRQRKIAAAAARKVTAPAPTKRAKPNAPAQPSTQTEIYKAGALEVIGWAAQPLAAAGFGMRVMSGMERFPAPRRQRLLAQGQALSLDALTLGIHADKLADGLAAAAPHIPWAARVLERAAKISPFSDLAQAGIAITFQVLCNHGLMPAMPALGTHTPEELALLAGVPMDGDEGSAPVG